MKLTIVVLAVVTSSACAARSAVYTSPSRAAIERMCRGIETSAERTDCCAAYLGKRCR